MRKWNMKYKSRGIVLSLIICLLQGCISDDVTLCYYDGVHLFFRFTTDVEEGTNQIDKENIQKIGLYAFDDRGVFYGYYHNEGRQITAEGYRFRFTLPTGKYSFVAWAEDETDTYLFSEFIQGVTRRDDVRLKLKTDPEQNVLTPPGELYYGAVEEMETDDTRLETQVVELEKNSNVIQINILNLPDKYSLANTNVAVAVRNGEYKFDNTIADTAQLLSYISTYTPHEQGKTAHVRVLKLEEGVESRLIVTTTPTSTRADEETILLLEKDLIKLLALYPNMDFKKQHDFTIDLDFGGGASVLISVNGWIVSSGDQNLE